MWTWKFFKSSSCALIFYKSHFYKNHSAICICVISVCLSVSQRILETWKQKETWSLISHHFLVDSDHVCVSVCMGVWECVCRFVSLGVCLCLFLCQCVCVRLCQCVCVCMSPWVCLCLCVCLCESVCVYTYGRYVTQNDTTDLSVRIDTVCHSLMTHFFVLITDHVKYFVTNVWQMCDRCVTIVWPLCREEFGI